MKGQLEEAKALGRKERKAMKEADGQKGLVASGRINSK